MPIYGLSDRGKYCISSHGLAKLIAEPKNTEYPGRNISWTDDIRVELPILVGDKGIESLIPLTIPDRLKESAEKFASLPALSVKRSKRWQTLTYKEYYEHCLIFGKSLIALGLGEFSTINIIGFNSPEWAIAFCGSICAGVIPVGIYSTNNKSTCEYIAEHSESQLVIAENMELAQKYFDLLKKGLIKKIVIYDDPNYTQSIEGVCTWKDFMKEGERVSSAAIQQRLNCLKPGNCCTLVYTSGTTGMPKAVILSHDNYTWTVEALNNYRKKYRDQEKNTHYRMVSYLPLSHVAGQFSDLIVAMCEGYHVYFADPSALQGSLIETLKEVRPNAFFSVPRVWEKIYEQMQMIAKSNGTIKTKIANWAKSLGAEGTIREIKNEDVSWQFKLAKILVYNNVKKALGLDQCDYFMYGAAPLDPTIRQYFLSLNFFLVNGYGMSECAGPQNFSKPEFFNINDLSYFKEVGQSLEGTTLKIEKSNPKDEDGEICYKGRNRFMGYYKNPADSSSTIDSDGFLHSGDNGKLTSDGILFITGRAKELIITAGGENIPPVLIENEIRAALPWIANVMVVGEGKKFLCCLFTLKEDPQKKDQLDKSTRDYLSLKGFTGVKIEEARKSPIIQKLLAEGLKQANSKAISKAQCVQNYIVLPEDFSIDNGLLTPTLKLKRKEVTKMYQAEIEKLYIQPSL